MKYLSMMCLLCVFLLTACGRPGEKQVSIAILMPVTHPSFTQMEQGFKATMEAQSPGKYSFITYNAQGNKTLMRSEVEEMAQQDYALVFTLGTSASQMTTDVFAKKGVNIPIVFTCVNDPVGFHIVDAQPSPENRVTGVIEKLDLEAEMEALIHYKPAIKRILLVYNPTEPGLQKDQLEIQRILQERHIDLIAVETFQTNEIKVKVTPFMEGADALVVLKDNTVITGLEGLIKLCEHYHIPLMASDLDSPDRGAAFGYGVYEVDFGTEAAKKALKILEEGIAPGRIAVTPVDRFSLRINREAAERQGVQVAEGQP